MPVVDLKNLSRKQQKQRGLNNANIRRKAKNLPTKAVRLDDDASSVGASSNGGTRDVPFKYWDPKTGKSQFLSIPGPDMRLFHELGRRTRRFGKSIGMTGNEAFIMIVKCDIDRVFDQVGNPSYDWSHLPVDFLQLPIEGVVPPALRQGYLAQGRRMTHDGITKMNVQEYLGFVMSLFSAILNKQLAPLEILKTAFQAGFDQGVRKSA